MSIVRVRPSYGSGLTYTYGSTVAEANAVNAAATVSIVVPSTTYRCHIDMIWATYYGGAASQTLAVTAIPLGSTVANVYNLPVAVTNTPAALDMNLFPGEFAPGQTITVTLPAGGASITGFVGVLYRID